MLCAPGRHKMMALRSTIAAVVIFAATASAFVNTPATLQPRSLAAATFSTAGSRVHATGSVRAQSEPHHLPTALRASEASTADATTYEMDEKMLRGPLTPIEDTVLVKVKESKKVTEGGLFLPLMKNERKTRGTVVAVGGGRRHWDTGVQTPIGVNAGEGVVYGNYDGTSIQYQGSEHFLMRATDLLMAFEGDDINLDTARMVGDRILVRVKTPPKGAATSSQGVLIAESAMRTTKPSVGVVVKVGPGRMAPSGNMIPMHCSIGDKIKYKVCSLLPSEYECSVQYCGTVTT